MSVIWDSKHPLRKFCQELHTGTISAFGGVGKPEPLRGELSGWWSKRIDQEHRLVYQVEGEPLIIAQARGHMMPEGRGNFR